MIAVPREIEQGRTVTDVCRDRGISQVTYWRSQKMCGGLEVSDFRRPEQAAEENRQLEKCVADLQIGHLAPIL